MAMAARQQGLPRQAPGRRRAAPARPKLGVVQGGQARASGSRPPARAAGTARRHPGASNLTAPVSHPARISAGLTAIALSAVFVLPLVLLNVYVAQNSFRLEKLQTQVSAEQNRYREMRYQVSMAESPARLAEIAGKLGLVSPAHQESLEGRPLTQEPPAVPVAAPAATNLKALLADRP